MWGQNQAGYAIQLTVRTEGGAVPYAAIENLTFSNNIIRGAGGGINFLGKDDVYNDGVMSGVTIRNNLFVDIDWSKWTGTGRLFQILNGPNALTIDHNTAIQTGPSIVFSGLPTTGFVYTNNLHPNGEGLLGPGTASGTATLNAYAPGWVFRRNVIAGAPASAYPLTICSRFRVLVLLIWLPAITLFASTRHSPQRVLMESQPVPTLPPLVLQQQMSR